MIRRDVRASFDAYGFAVLGGRSPATAGSRCQEDHGTA